LNTSLLNSIEITSRLEIRWIILPAALLVVFTLVFLFLMAIKRKKAAADGSVDPKYFRLYQGDGLNEELQLLDRHFNNLLETPLLFYFAVVVAILTQQVTTLTVVLSWLYFGFRMLHSWIHLNGNRVIRRFMVFGISVLWLFILWITLIIGLFNH